MASFNFFTKGDPSESIVKMDYISSMISSQKDSLFQEASKVDLGKLTDFAMLHFLCFDEILSIEDITFNNKDIFFRTDYSLQFLVISTKILVDPLLSQILIFNGIKCSKANVIESVRFIDSKGTTISTTALAIIKDKPLDFVGEISDLARIEITFKIPRKDPAFNLSLRIKDKTKTKTEEFFCDPQVGNDPPLPPTSGP